MNHDLTNRQPGDSSCTVIIVTHNSEKHLRLCIDCLKRQTLLPLSIVLVDSGSNQTDYLQSYVQDPLTKVFFAKTNIGFCKGNNLGMSLVPSEAKYILFLNPDAFLTPTFIEEATAYMEAPFNQQAGALSGILLGYDMEKNQPTGQIDSTGIFRTWYGRWYDRSQGTCISSALYINEEDVPALCGALMFCRKIALESIALQNHQIMDPSFYMYKEDIDLSIRLRKRGWQLKFLPMLEAYHCRGWRKSRQQVSKQLRVLSARNDIRVFQRLRSPCILYAALKYAAVKWLNI